MRAAALGNSRGAAIPEAVDVVNRKALAKITSIEICSVDDLGRMSTHDPNGLGVKISPISFLFEDGQWKVCTPAVVSVCRHCAAGTLAPACAFARGQLVASGTNLEGRPLSCMSNLSQMDSTLA
ncbi:hypothetical protein [Mycobacteroides sp. LB1]|uniref:hypothetical protein n=1 Tax=Mycobacteroides sp. LB1 TaxID=2750814 RepID=UPI0015DFF698|nr:hypothetical protein [Mycobacteroides sp. LB1]